MTVLRPYQSDGINRIRAAIREGHRRILVSAPTGSGKTVLATEGMILPAVARGKRVLFLAHRTELISQCYARLPDDLTGVIKSGQRPWPDAPIQVASVQTLIRRTPPPADLIIWDECHHRPAASYEKISALYPNAIHVGITATAYRSSGAGLGKHFDTIIELADINELIALGFLVPSRTFAPPAPDLTNVTTTAGDYNQQQLGFAVDKPKLVGNIVSTYLARANGRKAILFAVTVAHSRNLTAAFCQAGIRAAHLDGKTDPEERAGMIARLGSTGQDRLDVICNCGVLTEGTDIPICSCIILARPTKSRGLWKQCCGRGLRPHPSKTDCIILDHAGCYHRHGLITDHEEITLKGVVRKPNGAMPIRQCLACYSVVPGGCAVCPDCGAVFPIVVRKPIATEDGELTEAGAMPTKRMYFKLAEFEGLRLIVSEAVEKNYKPGWVGFTFKNRFGRWPGSLKMIEEQMMNERAKRETAV